MYNKIGKRLFDLALTIPALILLSPVMALLALLVRLKMGSPVLFRQQRPGLYGRPFTILKLRTMTNDCDGQDNLLPDEDRLTSFGRFLRSTSLDELPELFNVLKGEMSIVGPRPLLMEYLDHYTPEQTYRHEVRPGITGWAQIQGRNDTTWDTRFDQDLWYVKHCSFGLDCRIVFATVGAVLQGDGGIEQSNRLGYYRKSSIQPGHHQSPVK